MLSESQIYLVVLSLHIFLYSFLDRAHVKVYQAFVFCFIMARYVSGHSALGLGMCTSSFFLSRKDSPLLWSLVALWGMLSQQWINHCCCYLPSEYFPLDTIMYSTLTGLALIPNCKGKYHKKGDWIVSLNLNPFHKQQSYHLMK